MKYLKFIIPNTLTIINLLAGTLSIIFLFEGFPNVSIYLLVIAAVADVLDGLTAKILKATSEFGKQLDSLSDLVSFGVAPSVFVYLMVKELLLKEENTSVIINNFNLNSLFLYTSLLIAVFAALRLARFNIDTKKSTDFRGLPVPANALIVVSVWIAFHSAENRWLIDNFNNLVFFILLVIALSALMISNIPMMSLKFQNFIFKENVWRYILIVGSIFIFCLGGFSYLLYIMVFYLFISIIKNITGFVIRK